TRIYFQPDADLSGTLSDAVTFRAWDGSAGINGGTIDITAVGTGGGTPFSTTTDIAAIYVTPVNDAPVLSGSVNPDGWSEFSDPLSSGGPSLPLLSGVSLSDDAYPLANGGAMTICVGFDSYQSGDLISLPAADGSLVYDADSGEISLHGTTVATLTGGAGSALTITLKPGATISQAETILRMLRYTHEGDDPTAK